MDKQSLSSDLDRGLGGNPQQAWRRQYSPKEGMYISPLLAFVDLMRMQGQVVAAASSVRSGDVQGNGRMRAGLR